MSRTLALPLFASTRTSITIPKTLFISLASIKDRRFSHTCSSFISMELGMGRDANGEIKVTLDVNGIVGVEGDANEHGGSSAEREVALDQDDKTGKESSVNDPNCLVSTPSQVQLDEPFVGQEFESEAAAQAFYNAYATYVGFIVRVSKLSRSQHDGSVISRSLVCNKEGFRPPDKRARVVRHRAETRVGCRAMIYVRKVDSGKWVVTKFVKEHSHPLIPGKGRKDCIYNQYQNECDKIQELSQQLATEKKKAATYKRQLELLFEQIEEHNYSLSKKIQHIVDGVKEMESKDGENQV